MTWDKYYFNVCQAIASNSKCLSRQIGAILVRDKIIICSGYNGPPRGYPQCKSAVTVEGITTCQRRVLYKSGHGLHLCPAAHAERNAIVQAARLGITTLDSTLYLNTQMPCKDCLIELINAGIKEIVCTEIKPYDVLSESILEHSNIKIREFQS